MTRRLISAPGRRRFDGTDKAGIDLLLMEITHPALDAPLRLSTDMTERLSDDPLLYGSRSTWRGADPLTQPFHFIAADFEWPGDMEDDGPQGRVIFSQVHSTLLAALRSFTTPATCQMALMYADRLDEDPEDVMLDMMVRSGAGDLGAAPTVEVLFAPRPIWVERFPAARMTQYEFPGLYR